MTTYNISKKDVERFWKKVKKGGRCWEWVGHRNSYGYGRFYAKGMNLGAHRISYELAVGLIPAGLQIDHLCRNHSCVNPKHLEPVTNRENQKRGIVGSKTKCVNGHDYTPENTMWHKEGLYRNRTCRLCQKARNLRARERYRKLYGVTYIKK